MHITRPTFIQTSAPWNCGYVSRHPASSRGTMQPKKYDALPIISRWASPHTTRLQFDSLNVQLMALLSARGSMAERFSVTSYLVLKCETRGDCLSASQISGQIEQYFCCAVPQDRQIRASPFGASGRTTVDVQFINSSFSKTRSPPYLK